MDGLFEALNLWRTVRRDGGAADATDCGSLEEAIERIVAEVADTYPSFELRGLDWDAICERRVDAVRSAEDPFGACQAWLAELEDSHTWVWPGHGNLPYALRVDVDDVWFTHVPPESAGFAAGARPGWRLVSWTARAPTAAAGWRGRRRPRTRGPPSPAGGFWQARRASRAS